MDSQTTDTNADPSNTTGCGESALDLKIRQFETDVQIGHEIIHGDVNTEVMTENGPVPSFARRLALTNAEYIQRWESTLHSMQGVVAKTFWFPSSMVWHVVHNLDCLHFHESIRNKDGRKVITHGLNAEFVQFTIMVQDPTDLKWRNDIVPVEEVDFNSFRIDLTVDRNVKVSVQNAAQLV